MDNRRIHIGSGTGDLAPYLRKQSITDTSRERDTGTIISKPGEIIRREIILDKFWNTEDDYFASRSLDVFVTKLRKLLKKNKKVSIKTIKGIGLMITAS